MHRLGGSYIVNGIETLHLLRTCRYDWVRNGELKQAPNVLCVSISFILQQARCYTNYQQVAALASTPFPS